MYEVGLDFGVVQCELLRHIGLDFGPSSVAAIVLTDLSNVNLTSTFRVLTLRNVYDKILISIAITHVSRLESAMRTLV